MKLSNEESLESHSRLGTVKGQTEADILGWEVWPDGRLLWLEDGAQLQAVAALNGAGLWLTDGRCYDVFKQCLIRVLEALITSRH